MDKLLSATGLAMITERVRYCRHSVQIVVMVSTSKTSLAYLAFQLASRACRDILFAQLYATRARANLELQVHMS